MKKWVVFFLVTFLLVFMGSGCGFIVDQVSERIFGDTDDAAKALDELRDAVEELDLEEIDMPDEVDLPDGADEVEAANGEEVVDEDEFHMFNSMVEFGNTFSEVEVVTMENGTQTSMVNYDFLGEDTVDGMQTQQVNVTTDGGDYAEVWINESNEAVKAVVDGQEQEWPEAYGLAFLSLAFFTVDSDYSWTGWEAVSESTASRDLGAGSVNVQVVEVQYPYTDFTWTYEFAEIAGRNMIISMVMDFEDQVTENRISRLIPR